MPVTPLLTTLAHKPEIGFHLAPLHISTINNMAIFSKTFRRHQVAVGRLNGHASSSSARSPLGPRTALSHSTDSRLNK
jgi:hypothetical protein